MAGDRIINMGSGNYNENIHGNYIENHVHDNYINLSQDERQSVTEIQKLLSQLETQGYSSKEAKDIVAKDLATSAQNNPTIKARLLKLGQYLSNAAFSGLVGEATVEVVKLALRLLGISVL